MCLLLRSRRAIQMRPYFLKKKSSHLFLQFAACFFAINLIAHIFYQNAFCRFISWFYSALERNAVYFCTNVEKARYSSLFIEKSLTKDLQCMCHCYLMSLADMHDSRPRKIKCSCNWNKRIEPTLIKCCFVLRVYIA